VDDGGHESLLLQKPNPAATVPDALARRLQATLFLAYELLHFYFAKLRRRYCG
jgi:hypothetical protein